MQGGASAAPCIRVAWLREGFRPSSAIGGRRLASCRRRPQEGERTTVRLRDTWAARGGVGGPRAVSAADCSCALACRLSGEQAASRQGAAQGGPLTATLRRDRTAAL